jgi:hypothetical protein
MDQRLGSLCAETRFEGGGNGMSGEISDTERKEMENLADELDGPYFLVLSGIEDIARAVAFLLRRELERKS